MNDSEYERLMETAWKRPLFPDEKARLDAWLDQHPEARQSWDQEEQLTGILQDLPDIPLASNFTAQVLRALDQDAKTSSPANFSWAWPDLIRSWLPRMALASLILAVGGGFYWNHYQQRQSKLAQSMNIAGTMSVLPAPQALKDFEVISQLTAASTASLDLELLAALE